MAISNKMDAWLNVSAFLGEQVYIYLEIDTSQTSATTRWEALQAFIRGQIISYTSRRETQEKKSSSNSAERGQLLTFKLQVEIL